MRTNCWWRLSGYVMRHRRDLLLGFGAALAGTVIAVLVPLVTKRVIDDAVAADHRPLAPWAVVLVAAAGATYLLTYVRRYYGGRIAHLVQHDLRMDAFQALLRWDGRQQDRWSSGQLIVRTTNDLQLVQALLFDVPNVLRHVLTLLLGVAVMTWLSVPLALLAVLLVPVIGLIAHRSRRLLAAATHCAQEHKAAVTGVVDAAVCGIRVVKAFGQEERETVKLVMASRALYAAQLRVARLNAHFGPLLQTLPALGQMAVFALGGWMAAQGSITVGTFVAFWACLTLLARPACDLAGMLTIAQQARAGAVRVLELIDSRPTLVDGTKPLSLEARLSLEFQRVSFGYVADRPVLREISLSVRAGETLAVVGAPGSGKSTLASLATRCYDVTQGAVRIGGQDVRELTLDSLRSAIGLVPEDAVLFSGTIGANIAYGRPDATPEQIATAARAAHIEEFVNTLPDGYQTAVGARGLTLSGGQRQRIALARALLHQPRLLIMDDPTSAVDAVIECGIQEVLREAIADRTAVIFTRRRSMLTLADRVAVLDSGRLLDVGTPDEVWERCPRYRELLSPAPDLADDLVVAERSPVCRPVAGLGTKAAQHTNVHNPGPHDHPPGPDPLRRLLREFRGPLALSLLLVAVQTCAGLLPPLLIRHGIDVGIRRHVLSALWWAALAGTATVVIRWVVQWGSAMVAGYTGEQVLFRLRSVVFAHAQRLGLDAFEDDGDAQIVTAVTADVEAIVAFLRTGLVVAVISVVTLVGILVALLAIRARLVLLIFTTMPVLALATWQFRRASNWTYRRARHRLGTVTATLREYAAGLRIAQAFRAEYRGLQSYFAHSDDYRRLGVRGQRLLALYYPFVALLCSLATTLVLLDGAREVRAGVISVGALVTYLLYIELLYTPIGELAQMFDDYQRAAVAAGRIRSLLSTRTPSSPAARPVGAMLSNQCLGLGAPGRNTTGGTDIPHVVKRSGAKFREEFILRPDRVQMAPVNVISVAVVASDPLTRDGALARLSSHRELDVRAWQAGCETSVLLVLATTITAPLLCQIEDVQKDGPSHAPKLVVVADEFSAEQVFRMIKLGLTGLLYRSQSTFDCIVETIRLSAEGRLRLPERVQRYLVGRIKSTPTAEPDTPCAAALAEREVAVLRLLADGLSTHQVAVQLNYCERTIKNIVHDIVTRLKLRNRTHAVAHALRAGLI